MGVELAEQQMLVEPDAEAILVEADALDLDMVAARAEPSFAEAPAPSHDHSERAQNMSFEEALGAAGCDYLRKVAATRGEQEARRAFDAAQPTGEPGRPTKLIMAPPKKKPAAPSTPAKNVEVVAPTPKEQAKPEIVAPVPSPLQPQLIEALPSAVPVTAAETKAEVPLVAVAPLALPEVALPVVVHEVPEKPLAPLPLVAPPLEQLTVSASQAATAVFEQFKMPELAVAPSVILEPEEVRTVTAAAEVDSTMHELVLPVAIETNAFEPLPVAAPDAAEAFAFALPEMPEPAVMEQERPEATFEHFTEALSLLVSETPAQVTGEQQEPAREHPPLEAPVIAVVTEVASRLVELSVEQKETAMPIVQNIAESVRTIRQLQHEAAAPREIVAAVEEMREQIVQLFEAIGIEYDDEKIEYFVRAMLAPQLAIKDQYALTPEELAKMGTHEVKLDNQLAMILAQPTSDELPVSHRLGQIVLFFMHPTRMLVPNGLATS